MNTKQEFGWLKRAISGVILLAVNLLAGAALGLLWVKLFLDVDMGFGGIADTLGGAMVGMILALMVTGIAVFHLTPRTQGLWSGIAGGVAVIVLAGLVITAPPRKVSNEPVIKTKFRPAFVLRMKTNRPRSELATLPAKQRQLPFTEAEVWTRSSKLIVVDWGPDFNACEVQASNEDFARLLPLLQQVVSIAGPACRTPEDDFSLNIQWNIENNSGHWNLDAGCIAQQQAIVSLVNAVGDLAGRLCSNV
ncbi:MAG: hypothetical protein JAY82_02955 [Candidatus Thiodiazotropha taylori]|nr:hypothetical protein [Candidatus Thiodiazotropha taylori]